MIDKSSLFRFNAAIPTPRKVCCFYKNRWQYVFEISEPSKIKKYTDQIARKINS